MFHGRDPQAVATAAGLAYAAYGDGGSGLAGQLERLAPGWTALGASDLGLPAESFDAQGYYARDSAAGFVAVDGAGSVAVSFRGSDSTGDLLAVALNQPGHFAALQPMIQAALDYAELHGAGRVALTGHSLGGAMVQRTAAMIERFEPPPGVLWEMTAFGPPGTDAGDGTPFTGAILGVEHGCDPVTDSRPLALLTQHGRFTSIDLPTVQDAETLAELARQERAQESDPSIVTEHDMARYLASVRALAASPLAVDAADDAAAVILGVSDDSYALDRGNRLLLGLAGDDGLVGSAARDLIDAGAGDDRVDAAAGDDLLAGGPGDDALAGGTGLDTASFAAPSSRVDVRTYLGVSYAIPLDAGGLDGVDRLEGVELLAFADGVASQPADNFDALGYNASHADLADAFGTDGAAGLRHYAHFGLREGRGITFDGWQYLASFGDLIAAFGPDRDAASAHYISRGRLEGRSPDGFDARGYLDNYADLQGAFGGDERAATVHFVAHGYGEGRTDEPIPVEAVAAEGTSDFLL